MLSAHILLSCSLLPFCYLNTNSPTVCHLCLMWVFVWSHLAACVPYGKCISVISFSTSILVADEHIWFEVNARVEIIMSDMPTLFTIRGLICGNTTGSEKNQAFHTILRPKSPKIQHLYFHWVAIAIPFIPSKLLENINIESE